MRPKVSVIITTKNEEKYIETCLESVKNQTYPNVEIIVSDACSSDDTVKIAKKYADKVIVKETNIPEGKNLGAKYARGEYLVFVDAKVILDKNWIDIALKKLHLKNVVMVIGLFSYYEKSLRARIYGYLWRIITFACFKVGLPHVSGGCTTAVKKSKFNLVSGFREDLTNMEDVDLARRMKKIGDIVLEIKCRGMTSARRFEREGYIKWSIIWFVTGIWYYIMGKSLLKTYKCVR